MEKEFNYQGNKLFYRKTGKGSPVLLLHGFGEDGSIFDALLPALEKTATLLIPDIPGSGKSVIEEDFDFSMEHLASALKVLLDREEVSSCIILGHSMGGYIALAMAEQYPALINGLGLIHSSARADSAERKEKRKQAIQFIEQKGVTDFLQLSLPGLFSPEFRQNQAHIIKALIEKGSASFTPATLIGYYKAMMQRPDRTLTLSQLTCPVLLIMGEKDELIPFKDIQQQATLLQKPSATLIAGAGHMSMLETPTILATAIENFIKNTENLS